MWNKKKYYQEQRRLEMKFFFEGIRDSEHIWVLIWKCWIFDVRILSSKKSVGRNPRHSSKKYRSSLLQECLWWTAWWPTPLALKRGDQSCLDSNLIRFKRSSSNVFSITKTAILSKAYLVSKFWYSSSPFGNSKNFQKDEWEERVIKFKIWNPFYQRKLRQLS